MDVHIRTKIRTWWSIIETAVLRIGEDTLEVQGGKYVNRYWVNGKLGKQDLKHGQTLPETLAGYTMHFRWTSGGQRQFRVDLGNGDAVFFKTYGEFLRVNVKGTNDVDFQGSLGLMGSYPTGSKVARDNSTVFSDTNKFGLEWQVRSEEPMLFHVADGVQHPTKCRMPDSTSIGGATGSIRRRRRRLETGIVSLVEAEEACAHVEEKSVQKACVEDAVTTGNIDLAHSY